MLLVAGALSNMTWEFKIHVMWKETAAKHSWDSWTSTYIGGRARYRTTTGDLHHHESILISKLQILWMRYQRCSWSTSGRILSNLLSVCQMTQILGIFDPARSQWEIWIRLSKTCLYIFVSHTPRSLLGSLSENQGWEKPQLQDTIRPFKSGLIIQANMGQSSCINGRYESYVHDKLWCSNLRMIMWLCKARVAWAELGIEMYWLWGWGPLDDVSDSKAKRRWWIMMDW